MRFLGGSLRWATACLALCAAIARADGPVTPATQVPPDAATQLDTPEAVVEAQMRALAAWREDPAAPARVFSLASDANRAATGPLENFRRMVDAPPYDALPGVQLWSVGRAVPVDDAAAVLVTLLAPGGSVRAFRFYLVRQGDSWRTDGVLPAPAAHSGPSPEV